MHPKVLSTGLLALLGVLAFASSASCATVHRLADSGSVEFKATPSEVNKVTVKRSGKRYVIRDATETIAASAGCTNRTPHVVVCHRVWGKYAFVSLGDGDDVVRFRRTNGRVWAGAGDDVVRAANGMDALAGGPGSDELYGKGNNDILEDGKSPRTGGGRDKLVGGRGIDSVDYSRQGGRSLEIDLAGGQGLGKDELTGIEEVETAAGDDQITGDDEDNSLFAGRGINTVRGLAGDDELEAAGGSTLDGGAGDDQLLVTTETVKPARVDCGDGNDTAVTFPADELTSGCEFAAAGKALVWLSTLRISAGNVLRFRVSCLRTDLCAGALQLRRADGTVASNAEWEVNDDPSFVEFQLDQSDRESLAVGARFTASAPGDSGRGFTTTLEG